MQSLISEKVELEIPMAGRMGMGNHLADRMGMGNHLADRMVTGRRADIQVLLMKKT